MKPSELLLYFSYNYDEVIKDSKSKQLTGYRSQDIVYIM